MAEQSIYQSELNNLEQSKNFLKRSDYSQIELQLEFKKLVENYGELVDQVKIITKISDRLQRKLNKTNDALESSNTQLAELNNQLNITIDQLTEAKIGRKAGTIVMMVAIGLFIVSEVVLEPIIDANFNNAYVGLFLKLVVAILIKPGEDFANNYMLKKARKQQIMEQKEKREKEKAQKKKPKRRKI